MTSTHSCWMMRIGMIGVANGPREVEDTATVEDELETQSTTTGTDLAEDKNTKALEDPYDDKLPYTSKQKQKRFKHRLLLRQSQPGRLPTWLSRFRFPDRPYAERDNSFRGMYGPGFTYDRKNNIMYMDMEAVDAVKVFTQQLDYPLPHRMGARSNPQGFPMTVHEMDPRLGNLADNLPPPVYIPLDQAYRSTGGNTGGGADYPYWIDDGFIPLSIAYRPGYYTDYIEQWNTERLEEVPIKQAKETMLRRMVFHGARENLAEIDVIRHLAASGITQEMIDSAYPWAIVWVDQHQSIHFQDWYHHLEESRLQRLQQFGEPQIITELQRWWTPDIGDTHRIHVLIYNERYVHQPDGCNQQQDNPLWLLRGEDAVFRYINSFPPTTPQSPYQSEGSADIDAIQEDIPMTPMVDTAADDTLDIRPEAVPNTTACGSYDSHDDGGDQCRPA
ncbi:hypothetical protein ARMGADRAFT_1029000 [Armillaria gallica]|uniref:Uncharacterized protein n=1 Tax=Armillaria gallica TaxID=47427 RepID=A0A2H3DZS4_ARMGA|nr:hypothetical protein ARMGADRAFT_1029000 [Armillaria gallica]